ncbi:MAG: TonB-dependent receptor [Bacteroidota bacterium]
MKNILVHNMLFLLLSTSAFSQITFKGKVFDKANGDTIIGATVYIPDLKTGSVSDKNGEFKISNLPKGNFLVQIKFLGYSTITEQLEITTDFSKDFFMEFSTIEAQEIVITGSAISSDNSRTSVSIVSIDKNELAKIGGTNIIGKLASIPGISEITSGSGVSKPVIRGLSYNHVITLNEGVRQEGNQWGDEHGIEIDQFSADRIEILKGPASLFYGSDAMGGVINILEPIPANIGKIHGEFNSNFSTNNGLSANSLMFEGNHKGLIWRMRGTYKNSASYRTPSEYIYNSGFNETNYNAMFGLNKKWGYSHLHISKYNAFLGAIEGERDSASNKFVNAEGDIVSDKVLKGRKLDLPFQNVQHTKISSVSNIILNKNQLKLSVGYQTNDRKEFSENEKSPGLFFHLQSITSDVKYQVPLKNNYESVFGLSGMTQTNENLGVEFLVPNYNLQDIGGFAYLKKSNKQTTFNAGIRYDVRLINGELLCLDSLGLKANEGDTVFNAFDASFSAITGGVGLTYQLSKAINFKFNVGRGYRAPNIAELASNGIHEGTFRYELGDNKLKPETSLQIDGEIEAGTSFINTTFSAFYNTIENYIYSRNLNNEARIVDDNFYPVYRFVQGNSLLKGFEFSLDIHPLSVIHFENSFAYVHGENLSTKAPLPFIPAVNSKHSIRWNIKSKKSAMLSNAFVMLEISHHWKQNRFDVFETETNAYSLVNMSIGFDVKIKKQLLTIFINGNNLTNVKYFDHLNRLKYSGIYNIGRNITFGVLVPLDVKKITE